MPDTVTTIAPVDALAAARARRLDAIKKLDCAFEAIARLSFDYQEASEEIRAAFAAGAPKPPFLARGGCLDEPDRRGGARQPQFRTFEMEKFIWSEDS
jgi:hypothetical protein